jgi:Helix-turn-helix of DDE superfamily endonuclease
MGRQGLHGARLSVRYPLLSRYLADDQLIRLFPFPDRVVATVLHLRLNLPDDTLAYLFSTSRTTIRRALTETRRLLDQHGHRIEPVTRPAGPARPHPAICPPDGRQP